MNRQSSAGVAIGQVFPALAIPRMSQAHIMRWSAASENWHRIHYDHPFATGHDGLPDVVINGSFKQHVLINYLDAWFGKEGKVEEVSIEFRGMDVAGDRLTASAVVTGVETQGANSRLTLDIELRNDKGQVGTIGSAVVSVPAPYVPPAAVER